MVIAQNRNAYSVLPSPLQRSLYWYRRGKERMRATTSAGILWRNKKRTGFQTITRHISIGKWNLPQRGKDQHTHTGWEEWIHISRSQCHKSRNLTVNGSTRIEKWGIITVLSPGNIEIKKHNYSITVYYKNGQSFIDWNTDNIFFTQ